MRLLDSGLNTKTSNTATKGESSTPAMSVAQKLWPKFAATRATINASATYPARNCTVSISLSLDA